MNSIPIAVPPLAEQHRIVAKVDELMGLCDRLEAAKAKRESRRDRLVAASLQRLNNGADGQEFREYAAFHLNHLPRLAARPEHVQQLRRAILNLAVRAKLVPQAANDEPASELLKRISHREGAAGEEGRSEISRYCHWWSLNACPSQFRSSGSGYHSAGSGFLLAA